MNHIRIFKHYVNIHYIWLGVVEFILLFASVYIGTLLRFWGDITDQSLNFESLWSRALLFAFVMTTSMVAMGVYQSRNREGLIGMTLRTVVSFFLLGAIVLSAMFYIMPSMEIFLGRGILALSSVAGLFLVTILRIAFYKSISEDVLKRRVLVIGAGKQAQKFLGFLDDRDKNYILHGFVHVEGGEDLVDQSSLIHLNSSLFDYSIANNIDEIVVAVDERRRRDKDVKGFPLEELLDCKLNGVQVVDVLTFVERELGKIETSILNPSWLVFSDGFANSASRDYLERLFDIAASLTLLMFTWPFMLITVLAIKLEEGIRAPIIYGQERVGYKGRVFKVYKFRSMRVDAEKDGKAVWAQQNDSRVTRVGNVIRNTRIDELPQIFNVLQGQMSFVGPRPERPQFVDQLKVKIPYFDERHRVKPGITGWAQLCYPYGASDEDAEQKLQYDLYYIKNRSILLDLVILVQTVEVILIGKGVR